MKLGLLRFGKVPADVTVRIQEALPKVFPNTTCAVIDEELPVPMRAFEKKRGQYRSNVILNAVQRYAEQHQDFNVVLGIVDVDIFVSGLNFVFGEATFPGKAALISLWRLRPEFYRAPSSAELFLERVLKEAIHEIGHTLGLRHCSRPSCVMYFSNSIAETDKKQALFCERCSLQAAFSVNRLGGPLAGN